MPAAVAAATGARVATSNVDAAAARRPRRPRRPVLERRRDRRRDRRRRRGQARRGRRPTGCRSAPTVPTIDTTTSNAEELAALLPTRHVVKAFNTLFASNQADPIADGVQLDGFVAGDDAAAKARCSTLVASIGLDPVDVGPLARARQLEGLAFLNIALNIANGGSWQSGWKLVGAPATAPGSVTIDDRQPSADGADWRR